MQNSRIPSLDGLRAVAILLVIVGHSIGGQGLGVALSTFGVYIFFVLSGYLITTLLQEERERRGRISLAAFYKRRCFRIFPAAYAYILVIALFVPASRPSLAVAATYTASYHFLTIAGMFQHLWSLSVEEQFYLLWPLALVFGYRHRAKIAIAAMICAACFRLWNSFHSDLTFVAARYSFLGTMDAIAAGCLLAIYRDKVAGWVSWFSDIPALTIALPATAWTLNIVLWKDQVSVLWGVVPLLIAAWLMLLVMRRDRLLNHPLAVWLGALSYSLYLWQQPFVTNRSLPVWAALTFCVIAAVCSYTFIEQPFISLGRRLARQQQHTRISQEVTADADRDRLSPVAIPGD